MNSNELCRGRTAISHLYLCDLQLWCATEIRDAWRAAAAIPTCRDYAKKPLRQIRGAMRHKSHKAIMHFLTALVLLRTGALR